MKTHLAALLTATALATPAAAQDFTVYAGGGLEHLVRPDGDGEPSRTSAEIYVEGEASGFYFGVWAWRENTGEDEVDLYLGYRRDLDSGISYDLSYNHYTFPGDSASNYGEFILGVSQTLGDTALVSADLGYEPDSKLSNLYLGFEYYPAEKWTISANIGTYEVDGAGSEQEWDLGATYNFTDEASIDIRYYDGTEYTKGYLGLFLAFDTTVFGG